MLAKPAHAKRQKLASLARTAFRRDIYIYLKSNNYKLESIKRPKKTTYMAKGMPNDEEKSEINV